MESMNWIEKKHLKLSQIYKYQLQKDNKKILNKIHILLMKKEEKIQLISKFKIFYNFSNFFKRISLLYRVKTKYIIIFQIISNHLLIKKILKEKDYLNLIYKIFI